MSNKTCDRCGKIIQTGKTHLCEVKKARPWQTCDNCGSTFAFGTIHSCSKTSKK